MKKFVNSTVSAISSSAETERPRLPTKAEWEAETQRRKDNERLRRELESARQKTRNTVALTARQRWSELGAVDPDHMQLLAHGISQTDDMRQDGDKLVMRMMFDGEICNLVSARQDGGMYALSGGRRSGTYILFGQVAEDQPLYLTEKWTTGAKFHQETGAAVACSLFAGNLLAAGRSLEILHPYNKLVLILEASSNKEVCAAFNRARAELARSAIVEFGEGVSDER